MIINETRIHIGEHIVCLKFNIVNVYISGRKCVKKSNHNLHEFIVGESGYGLFSEVIYMNV